MTKSEDYPEYEYLWKQHGCPIFPPAHKSFEFEGRMYFVGMIQPGEDVNDLRLTLEFDQIRGGRLHLANEVVEILRALFGLVTRPRTGQFAVCRMPADEFEQWITIYTSEPIPIKDLQNSMCEFLTNWPDAVRDFPDK